jgi:molecular chaperone GrpE
MAENKETNIENEENKEEVETTEVETVEESKCEVCEEASETTDTEESTEDKEDWEMKYNALNDKYIRAYADFENSKKRLEKEKYNSIDYAVEKFAMELLPCMDSLELALASANNTEADPAELLAKLKEGIELTQTQFNKALEKSNVEVIETDDGFDPNYHNAVMQVADEAKEDGEIVQVLQKGYKLKERVLRASMVSICKK